MGKRVKWANEWIRVPYDFRDESIFWFGGDVYMVISPIGKKQRGRMAGYGGCG